MILNFNKFTVSESWYRNKYLKIDTFLCCVQNANKKPIDSEPEKCADRQC